MKTVSVETYQRMGMAGLIGEDTELLYGTIYKKPRKEPLECAVTSRLLNAFAQMKSEGYLVRTFQPITCVDSEPEPNVSVVRGELDDYIRAHPRTAELVIEVCVGNEEYDRAKLRAYATAEVKEFWLALGLEKRIEVYVTPSNGTYLQNRVHGPGGQLISHSFPFVTIDLDKLFVK